MPHSVRHIHGVVVPYAPLRCMGSPQVLMPVMKAGGVGEPSDQVSTS